MNGLLSRAIDQIKSDGVSGLINGALSFVSSGEARYKIIGSIPGTTSIIRSYVSIGHEIFPGQYTDANPFKLLWISPTCIQYEISGRNHYLRRFGRVYDGNWDQDLDEISHNTVYKAFDKRFNDGKDWEETEYYRKLRAKIVDGKSTRAGHSQSELQQYFGDLETLYENIVDNGYQTQSELEETAPKRTRVKNMDAPIPSMNEIGVCIGRDGTLIHRYRGAHRLAVAKTAGIDAVPVQVLSRHKQWQCIRDTFRDARTLDDVDQEYRSHYGHPDLEDVAPETD